MKVSNNLLIGGVLVLGTASAMAAPGGPGGGLSASAPGPSIARGQSIAPTAPTTAPTDRPSSSSNMSKPIPQEDTTLRGPTATGQPNVECGEEGATSTPGNAASAPGSAFNEEGVAGTKYAGEQPQNSRNTASRSQYDTACAHQPN